MLVADMLSALRIKANLIADKTVGLMEINAEVHDGTAILIGEVETDPQKSLAEKLAHEVEGVEKVDNKIEVVPLSLQQLLLCEGVDGHMGYGPMEGDVGDTPLAISGAHSAPGPGLATSEQFPGQFTDDKIEAEVKHKLATEKVVDASDIQFNSVNQILHVKGSVKTPDDLNELQDMLLNVRGVMGVSSEVTVEEGDIGTPLPQ